MAEKTLQELPSVFVADGAGGEVEIRVGDRVALIPAERRERNKDRAAWMRLWLGPGPYVVSFIGYNPHPAFTGKPLLFCKYPDGSESGAFASEFEKAWPRWSCIRRGYHFYCPNQGFRLYWFYESNPQFLHHRPHLMI